MKLDKRLIKNDAGQGTPNESVEKGKAFFVTRY